MDESVVLQRVLNVSGIPEAKVHWRDVVNGKVHPIKGHESPDGE